MEFQWCLWLFIVLRWTLYRLVLLWMRPIKRLQERIMRCTLQKNFKNSLMMTEKQDPILINYSLIIHFTLFHGSLTWRYEVKRNELISFLLENLQWWISNFHLANNEKKIKKQGKKSHKYHKSNWKVTCHEGFICYTNIRETRLIFGRYRWACGTCIYSKIMVKLHDWASQKCYCWLQVLENVHYCYWLCSLESYMLTSPFYYKNTYLPSSCTSRTSHSTVLPLSWSNCLKWMTPDGFLRFLFTFTASVSGFLPRCSHFFLCCLSHSTFFFRS